MVEIKWKLEQVSEGWVGWAVLTGEGIPGEDDVGTLSKQWQGRPGLLCRAPGIRGERLAWRL